MIPNNVVRLFQRGALRRGDQFFQRGHKRGNRILRRHSADTVISAGHNADQLPLRSAVLRDRHGRVTGCRFQGKDVGKRLIRAEIGVTAHKSGFETLDFGNHRRLAFNGLRAVNKGDAAFLCESHCQSVTGDRLHDSGNQRDIQRNCRLFSLFKTHQRGFQGHVCRDALRGRITGNQQILVERMRRFLIIGCHILPPLEPGTAGILTYIVQHFSFFCKGGKKTFFERRLQNLYIFRNLPNFYFLSLFFYIFMIKFQNQNRILLFFVPMIQSLSDFFATPKKAPFIRTKGAFLISSNPNLVSLSLYLHQRKIRHSILTPKKSFAKKYELRFVFRVRIIYVWWSIGDSNPFMFTHNHYIKPIIGTTVLQNVAKSRFPTPHFSVKNPPFTPLVLHIRCIPSTAFFRFWTNSAYLHTA